MPLAHDNRAYGAHLMAFAGIPSFMRQPATRELAGADAAIVGVPFDGGTTSFRTGARFGPRKIREASLLMWGHNAALGVSPLDRLRVVDYGDVDVTPTSIRASLEAIADEVGAVVAAGPTVISLGGDHSIALPLLRAHARRYGPLAVIQFDAHNDTSDREYDHGTPFRRAIEEGLVDTAAFVQIGIRGPTDGPRDIENARDLGARVITIREALRLGPEAVAEAARAQVGGRPAYVSLDIDAVDPAFAPGTGTPEVGGFSSFQMLEMVRGLQGLNLVGFDLVEVCPPYDHGDITAILAANLAFEFLSLVALRQDAAADGA
jgi:agmatinase/guanidinopropionase